MDRAPESLLAPRLLALATATGYLSPGAIKLVGGMLAELDRMNARQAAIFGAWSVLWPEVGSDRWRLALELEREIKRFEVVGYRRVKGGYRAPDSLEKHLTVMLDCGGPRCHEKLYLELKELTAPSQ